MINILSYTAFVLVFFRLLAFMLFAQVFFPKGTPAAVKVGISLLLSYIVLPTLDISYFKGISNNYDLFLYAASEITTGLILAFIVNIFFNLVRYAGQLVDLQAGFSFINVLDPSLGANSTLVENLFYWFSLITFFNMDGHHLLIKEIVNSFSVIHIGKLILFQETAKEVINIFISLMGISVKIAFPILLVLLITDLTMALVARTVPQINVMILGFPIKLAVCFITITLGLPLLAKIISSFSVSIVDILHNFYKFIPMMFVFASEDKSEAPTPKKLEDAKKKGQVARSKDVNLAFTLLASTIVINLAGEYVFRSLKGIVLEILNSNYYENFNAGTLVSILKIYVPKCILLIFVFAIPILIFGIASSFIQTGFMFTTEVLKPDLKKLNFIEGFKRMFSIRSVVELLKDSVIVVVVGYVGYSFLKSSYPNIFRLFDMSINMLPQLTFGLIKSIFLKITIIMMIIATVDFIYQKFKFKKEMKMTKQEVKEEMKQAEGDPEIKGKIKQKQRQMSAQRMMQNVPKATVVVTNPTHYAAALKYEEGVDSAPVLVAKGKDYVAYKIKSIASENDIPIIENKPLARLIYDDVEIESEVPSEMYDAVAEIIAVVLKIKKTR